MASISREQKTKDGRRYYLISVSRGHGKTPYRKRWYRPDGWSDNAVKTRLGRVAGEFEQDCIDGKVLNRAQSREQAAQAAAEAAKLLTVQQYAEAVFLPEKTITVSENTRTSYTSMLQHHVFPTLGAVLLEDVNPAMCRKLLLDFQKDHAHASVVKLYVIMCGLFDAAFQDDMIPVSPMLKVKRPKPRADEEQPEESEKAYSAQELADIYKKLNAAPLKWQAYIRLMAYTGLRRGECCGVQWQDIDFKAKEITIRHNIQYTVKAGVFDKRPKNGKVRTVDIDDDVIDVLRRWRTEQSCTAVSRWVFTQKGSTEVMFPQSPNRFFNKFAKENNIDGFHPHKLRHTSVSISLQGGADLASVSARAGHSDPSITARIYAHSNKDGIRRAGQVAREAVKLAAMEAVKQAEQKQMA